MQEISDALRGLLPVGAVASAGAVSGSAAALHPAELLHAARMSPRRLEEFTAGRTHARRALALLNHASPAIPVGADRSPQWPAGFVGSISHAGQLVLAVAAPVGSLAAIGIDIEPDIPLDADLLARVCRPEELVALRSSPAPARRAKLVFSAKESVYKCTAPVNGVFLEFEDLEILFDAGDGRFRVRGHGPVTARLDSLTGAYTNAGGYWLTAAWLPPAAG